MIYLAHSRPRWRHRRPALYVGARRRPTGRLALAGVVVAVYAAVVVTGWNLAEGMWA